MRRPTPPIDQNNANTISPLLQEVLDRVLNIYGITRPVGIANDSPTRPAQPAPLFFSRQGHSQMDLLAEALRAEIEQPAQEESAHNSISRAPARGA